MEKKFKRTTVTSALPYANGPVHIGHLAGVYVPADIYVRYLRLKKEDVLFIGGSDEHGVPITIRAKKEGITPQDVVDRYHSLIKKSFEEFGISFDVYSRTSSPTHHQLAKKRLSNTTMKKLKHSSPTVISPENVLTATRKEHTVTNVRNAVLHSLRQISLIRKAPSAGASR